MKKINPRRVLFAYEYLKDLNATQAAIRAGYSKKTANEQGARLLANVSVKKLVRKLKSQREKRTEITQDKVLKEIALLAFSDIKDICEIEEGGMLLIKQFDDIPNGKTRTIKAVKEDRIIRETAKGDEMVVHDKVRYELYDKIKPLEMLCKHLGILKENGLNIPITLQVVSAVPRSKGKGKDAS